MININEELSAVPPVDELHREIVIVIRRVKIMISFLSFFFFS